MVAVVDICNAALSHLGDRATVTSIDPPEGSPQAEHCARFYPMARDALLELHEWGFITVRAQLAQVSNIWPEWDYAYAAPDNMINTIAVHNAEVTDDYSTPIVQGYTPEGVTNTGTGIYSTQPYALEYDALTDTSVILTDVENAVLRYTQRADDPTNFSPLFVSCLSFYLASYLAGPIIKGDTGMAVAEKMEARALRILKNATVSDANDNYFRVQQSTPWIAGR